MGQVDTSHFSQGDYFIVLGGLLGDPIQHLRHVPDVFVRFEVPCLVAKHVDLVGAWEAVEILIHLP